MCCLRWACAVVEGGEFKDLALDPRQRWVLGDIDMNDPPCIELHDHEYVDYGEKGSVLRHEVACEDLVAVVLEKRLPSLLGAWGWSFHHVLSNRTGGELDAQLEIELCSDLVFAEYGGR